MGEMRLLIWHFELGRVYLACVMDRELVCYFRRAALQQGRVAAGLSRLLYQPRLNDYSNHGIGRLARGRWG
jgi:hypothetical protein